MCKYLVESFVCLVQVQEGNSNKWRSEHRVDWSGLQRDILVLNTCTVILTTVEVFDAKTCPECAFFPRVFLCEMVVLGQDCLVTSLLLRFNIVHARILIKLSVVRKVVSDGA